MECVIVNFDFALNNSIYERRNLLKTSSAPIWLGNFFYAPKIVIDKCVTYARDLAKITIFFALIVGFILTGFF